MPLKLTITSAHKELLGDDYVREFGDGGGTIGRALHNDWILPDPDKFISGQHATIDCRKGSWYLADLSTNGIYVNDDHEPLGRGNPRRLYNGDRLRMGDFEFAVRIDEGEELELPPPPLSIVPDDFDQMVPEEPLKTGIQLLDEEEITGDEAFRSTVFGSQPKPLTAPPTLPAPAAPPAPAAGRPKPAIAGARPARFPQRPARDGGDPTAEQLLGSFLSALGIAREEIHPDADLGDVMRNAGYVLRELVDGAADLMTSRTHVKTMFRLDQTTVLPHHNNPLRLSRTTNDSLKQLLLGDVGEYLDPQEAVREVCQDLKLHHAAIVEAMTATVSDFAEQFNPAELKETFERSGNRKPLLDALGKLRFWNLYCELYPELTESGDGRLPLRFGEDFVRNYEKCLADFKRAERKSSQAA